MTCHFLSQTGYLSLYSTTLLYRRKQIKCYYFTRSGSDGEEAARMINHCLFRSRNYFVVRFLMSKQVGRCVKVQRPAAATKNSKKAQNPITVVSFLFFEQIYKHCSFHIVVLNVCPFPSFVLLPIFPCQVQKRTLKGKVLQVSDIKWKTRGEAMQAKKMIYCDDFISVSSMLWQLVGASSWMVTEQQGFCCETAFGTSETVAVDSCLGLETEH